MREVNEQTGRESKMYSSFEEHFPPLSLRDKQSLTNLLNIQLLIIALDDSS